MREYFPAIASGVRCSSLAIYSTRAANATLALFDLHQPPSHYQKEIIRPSLSRLSASLKAIIGSPPHALRFWHLIGL